MTPAQTNNRSISWLLVILVMAPLTMVSCSDGDDLQAIRELIKQGASLAENHDLSGLMELTTDAFQALPGQLNRHETRRILWTAFRHYGNFRVMHPRPDVELDSDGSAASASVPFLILKKEHTFPDLQELYEAPQRWLEEVGESADLYRLKLELVKKDGNWLVRQVVLKRFTGVSFSTQVRPLSSLSNKTG